MTDDRPIQKSYLSALFQGLFEAKRRTRSATTKRQRRPIRKWMNDLWKRRFLYIRVTGIYRWLGYHAVSIVMTDPGRKVRLSTEDGKECCNSVFNPYLLRFTWSTSYPKLSLPEQMKKCLSACCYREDNPMLCDIKRRSNEGPTF